MSDLSCHCYLTHDTDTVNTGICILPYHSTWVTVTCIFMYSRSRVLYYYRHCYFMYLYHRLHEYATLVFHVLVSLLHGYSTLWFHVFIAWIHLYTCFEYFSIPITWITIHVTWITITWIFMYSYYIVYLFILRHYW